MCDEGDSQLLCRGKSHCTGMGLGSVSQPSPCCLPSAAAVLLKNTAIAHPLCLQNVIGKSTHSSQETQSKLFRIPRDQAPNTHLHRGHQVSGGRIPLPVNTNSKNKWAGKLHIGSAESKRKRGWEESSAPWGGVQVGNKKARRPERVCTLRGKGLTTLTQNNAESQQRISAHCALGACSCVLGWSLVVLWHDLRSRH